MSHTLRLSRGTAAEIELCNVRNMVQAELSKVEGLLKIPENSNDLDLLGQQKALTKVQGFMARAVDEIIERRR